MHLLDTETLKLRQFFGKNIPPYAILSHRWEEEEVQFRDLEQGYEHYSKLKGFAKIQACCHQARSDDHYYVWIDTCCINSDSSAELSESINSMYTWYSRARVCYAYLSDVDANGRNLDQSVWFERGWTLQELLAPRRLNFYSDDWRYLGTKVSLEGDLERVTGIAVNYLSFPKSASVAQKMSWMAKRQTTKEEDIAYCLFGLFDVNMPLLYGEGGQKAFLRLQQEILKITNDETIFAWENPDLWASGMLALYPAEFANCHDIESTTAGRTPRLPSEMTNLGLKIDVPQWLNFLPPRGTPQTTDSWRNVVTPLLYSSTEATSCTAMLYLLVVERHHIASTNSSRQKFRVTGTRIQHNELVNKVAIDDSDTRLNNCVTGEELEIFVSNAQYRRHPTNTRLTTRNTYDSNTGPAITLAVTSYGIYHQYSPSLKPIKFRFQLSGLFFNSFRMLKSPTWGSKEWRKLGWDRTKPADILNTGFNEANEGLAFEYIFDTLYRHQASGFILSWFVLQAVHDSSPQPAVYLLLYDKGGRTAALDNWVKEHHRTLINVDQIRGTERVLGPQHVERLELGWGKIIWLQMRREDDDTYCVDMDLTRHAEGEL